MRTVYYLYFLDEETDDQRSKGTPSNSHGSEMVELGYHRSHLDVKIPGLIGIMGKTVACSFFKKTMKFEEAKVRNQNEQL